MIARGVAYLCPLEMLTTAGAADTGVGALTVVVSKDGADDAPATNAAVQVAGTHVWTVLLTLTEMTADLVSVVASRAGDVPCTRHIQTEGTYTGAKAAFIDAAITSRSTYAGGEVASVAGAVGSVSSPVTVATNNDKSGYALTVAPPTAAAISTAVWSEVTRTLSAFGFTVAATVADKTGYALAVTPPTAGEVATAVWGAVTRTLSAFGFTVPATVADKTGYSLAAAPALPADVTAAQSAIIAAVPAGTQTGLIAQGYTAARAGYLDTLNGLVAAAAAAVWATIAYGATSILTLLSQIRFTVANKIDATAVVDTSGIAGQVWANASRTLTEKTGFALTAAYDKAKAAASTTEAAAILAAVQALGTVVQSPGVLAPTTGTALSLLTGNSYSWLVYQDALVAGATYKFRVRHATSEREVDGLAPQTLTFAAAAPGAPGAFVATITLVAPEPGSYSSGVGYGVAGVYQGEIISWAITCANPEGPWEADF